MWARQPGLRSPALSLDSMHSGAAVSTGRPHLPPDPQAFWSDPAHSQLDRCEGVRIMPAWRMSWCRSSQQRVCPAFDSASAQAGRRQALQLF